MSIIGPRPALGYEVAAYKPWHRLRLGVTPGVSGLWQIAGRSRVSFDEMVFQDVMYTYNQSLLTDVVICARTVPAVLMGRGAA
jgi:lipopolysaccharide/colanic/teichoic acid biosynthesis glycosyltransferase